MSLLIEGALPGSPIAPGFESQVRGETAGGSFGDLLAQLFAAPAQRAEALAAELEVEPEGPQLAEAAVAEAEVEEGAGQPSPLANLLALPHLTVTTLSPITLTSPAPSQGGEPQPAGTTPPQSPAEPASELEAPAFDSAEAQPVAGELPIFANGQPTEPSTDPGGEQQPIAMKAVQPPVEASEATQPSQPSPIVESETQQSVVRPVGNANASNGNGNNEGNREQGRPQFANNVVAAAHNASQTGGAAVAEVAQSAGAESAPQLMAPDQVVEAVIERAEAGGGEVSIRLDPPELGEVTIRVITDGDSVRVHIQVERPEAVQLLRNAASALESLLSERGLDLSDVFVGADQRGPREQSGKQSEAREDESETPFSALLSAPPGAEVRQHNRIRSAYNPDGALLYRV